MKVFYIAILTAIVVFSYGFVDPNFSYQPFSGYFAYLHKERVVATIIYILLLFSLIVFYIRLLSRPKMGEIWQYIWITIVILFFAYPAFSSDLFNYIATAKVTYLYRENPYIVMPIEIESEPMLSYLHAGNKVALYGPSWIALTALPHYLGFGNIIATMIMTKILVVLFYLWLIRQIEYLSNGSAWSVAFFALNPLVIMETLVAVHQDVVMMALALYSFTLLKKRRVLASVLFIVFSVFIKGATLFLLPVYVLTLLGKIRNVWFWCAISMMAIFILSPIREEMYPWYFIWIITFVSLLPRNSFLVLISLVASFGLELRIVPYLYTWRWDGITPMVKKIVSVAPPAVVTLWYAFRKKI